MHTSDRPVSRPEVDEEQILQNTLLTAQRLLWLVPVWQRPPGTQKVCDRITRLLEQRRAKAHEAA